LIDPGVGLGDVTVLFWGWGGHIEHPPPDFFLTALGATRETPSCRPCIPDQAGFATKRITVPTPNPTSRAIRLRDRVRSSLYKIKMTI
jgi:hypothetical protein